jgi:tetratricopeptide (TPR) repeat protein
MNRFFRFILRYKIIAALLLCAGIATAVFLDRPRPHPESTNPDVISPVFAVEFLEKWDPKSLYYTLSAHDYLAAKKPAWVSAQNTDQALQELFHAGQDIGLWRKQDHLYHFDAVLLCGEPSEFQPLLEGLILSKDWTLVYLDQTSIIFRRPPAAAWTRVELKALIQKFAGYPPVDRAAFLTLLASKLLAIGWYDDAKQQLDEALGLDHDSPATWTELALYDLHHNPAQALEDTDRALKLDKDYYYALTARIRVLMLMKRYEDALHVSDHMLETQKNNPGYSGMLFFHAAIAREAHAYVEEIKTLNNLIAIVSAQKQPVAFYRVYLAQAYEFEGDARLALDEFQKALDEGTLNETMSEQVKVQMNSINKQISDGS